MTQSPETIALVLQLWPDYSAAQIGEKLRVSKNVVVGIHWRHGRDIGKRGDMIDRRPIAVIDRARVKARKEVKPMMVKPPRLRAEALPAPPPPPVGSGTRTFLAQKPGDCKWPDWPHMGPKPTPDSLVCGRPVDPRPGCPYCTAHRALAYQPPRPKLPPGMSVGARPGAYSVPGVSSSLKLGAANGPSFPRLDT